MAELVYFTGPMDCGKSTLALQLDWTESSAGRVGYRCTRLDRSGAATISSRLGLVASAVEVTEDFDFVAFVEAALAGGHRVDYLVCDEAHFYSVAQIDQLVSLVDEGDVDVFCFGILTDFRTRMFPGSARLVETCDRMEFLQVRPRCWCGERATHNARVVGGVMVLEGEQIAVGDTRDGDRVEVSYQVLCRRHHRQRRLGPEGR